MNLQPLFDLKERLEYAAIAGTGLMREDFRLHRAVEAMTPLAGVNPVFGKIAAAAKSLLAAAPEERNVRLLDTLSLVDAVVYTQGVSNVAGDLEPLEPGSGTYVEVSYGQLQPLLTALSGTGSGRMELIQNVYAEHPEYFSDYRIQPYVLNALADKYLELADYIETILLEQGPAIVPALKNGFDSAGQADMVRRVRLVAMLAGGRENDWFVSILPASVKKIREAVIHSLGYSQENGPLLMDLCRTERGKLKEAAMRSLAMMEDEACLALLREEVGKKPENVGFLRGIDSTIAADLTTQAVRTRMERFREEDEGCGQMQWARVVELMDTVVGMYSPGMEQFWHWASRYMVECEEHSPSVVEILKENFMHTVLRNPRTEVLALARSLAAENGRWFLGSAFLADMMELSPEALCDRYGPMIDRTGQETEEQQNVRCQILSGLSVVRWDRQLRRYVQSFLSVQPMTGKLVPVTRVMEGLDPRWLGVLVDPAISDEGYVNNLHESGIAYQASYKRDALICQLIDEDNPTVCRLVGAWLHCNTVNQGNIMRYFNPMLRCGWKNWKGLLVHCVVKSGHVSYVHVMKWIQKTPISNAEKAEELRQVDMLVREGKLRLGMFRWPGDQVRECIAALEADPNWQVEWRGFM